MIYKDEWEPVMTAESMEEKITAFAEFVEKRTDEGEDIKKIQPLIHESYLLKHTTTDILRELRELVELYPDAFYDGDANEHVMQHVNKMAEVEFWHDYSAAALASGLEWAVLKELGASRKTA